MANRNKTIKTMKIDGKDDSADFAKKFMGAEDMNRDLATLFDESGRTTGA